LQADVNKFLLDFFQASGNVLPVREDVHKISKFSTQQEANGLNRWSFNLLEENDAEHFCRKKDAG
jgi:hypothetical protein